MGGFLPHHDERVRVLVGQRFQQHRIDHAKDRTVCADPESEGDHSHDGEPRVAHQHPQPVSQVLPKISQHIGFPFRPHHHHGVLGHAPLDPLQFRRQKIVLVQLAQHRLVRLLFGRRALKRLLVLILEMLRQLFDNFILPRRRKIQRRQPLSDLLLEIRHAESPLSG